MKSVSSLFDKRSQMYSQLYSEAIPNRLLHQEKQIRCAIACDLVCSISDVDIGSLDVVDVGCGSGNVLLTLREKGVSGRLVGVDVSTEMINVAKANRDDLGISGVEFYEGSVSDLDEKSGVVVSLGVIGYQNNQAQFIESLTALVNENGYIIISTASGESIFRYVRNKLSIMHSRLTGKVKSLGLMFKSMTDTEVDHCMRNAGFHKKDKICISYGLGLFPSRIECSFDRFMVKRFSRFPLSKYFSLTTIYIYRRN